MNEVSFAILNSYELRQFFFNSNKTISIIFSGVCFSREKCLDESVLQTRGFSPPLQRL
jgi:hypothetical protein